LLYSGVIYVPSVPVVILENRKKKKENIYSKPCRLGSSTTAITESRRTGPAWIVAYSSRYPMAPKNEKPLHSLVAGATAGGIEA